MAKATVELCEVRLNILWCVGERRRRGRAGVGGGEGRCRRREREMIIGYKNYLDAAENFGK